MSSDIRQSAMDQIKENKSFEFVKLYQSAADNKANTQNTKKAKKNNKNSVAELNTEKRAQSPNKNKKKKDNVTLDLSHIEAVDYNSSKAMRSSRKTSLTSTPNCKGEYLDVGVKSIMKNKSNNIDSQLNVSIASSPSRKPKKRNKSVSFMLEDGEELVVKKSKSNNSSKEHKTKEKDQKDKEKEANTKIRKQKKSHQAKVNQKLKKDMECSNKENVTLETVQNKVRDSTLDAPVNEEVPCVKKKVKKNKKREKPHSELEQGVPKTEDIVNGETSSENKTKKSKKKKRKVKSTQDGNTDSTEGEPAVKTRKRDLKPEAIAEGLENLNIGDNAHTLTNLLDEMTVVDKNAKKKERRLNQKRNKAKKHMSSEDNTKAPQQSSNVEEKEKVKWNKRKWNKDGKGDCTARLRTSVVVENLSIKIMCNYKKLLSEHFGKFGTIAGVGVAEAYPTEDLKPVFTTTVFFQEEESATKALAEDNTVFEGSRIAVRRPRAPTETTLVARGHGLSEQVLSTLYSAAGRVRSIRLLVKGKKSMPTAFVEFDGPEAVERALKITEDAKVNGKKMYVSKFEIRTKTKRNPSEKNSTNDDDDDSSTE